LIKERKMRWTEHMAHIKELRNATKFWSGNLKGRNHWEVIVLDCWEIGGGEAKEWMQLAQDVVQ
jgi:hypothetical protein